MEKEKEARNKANQQKAVLIDFMKKQEITAVIAKYSKPLNVIYKNFAQQDDNKGSLLEKINEINFTKFAKFCSTFLLVPELMSTEDLIFIYRHSTKAKMISKSIDISQYNSTPLAEKNTQYLSLEEFFEILVKIGILLKDKLDSNGQSLKDMKVNRELDVTNVNENILINLMKYMGIEENDNKQTIDKKLVQKSAESKSIKRMLKKNNATTDNKLEESL